jgi:hypothetical protein
MRSEREAVEAWAITAVDSIQDNPRKEITSLMHMLLTGSMVARPL